MLIVCATLPCILAINTLDGVPESPLWLVETGDLKEAVSTLRRIAAENGKSDVLSEPDATYEQLFKNEEGAKGTAPGDWAELASAPASRTVAPALFVNWICEGASYYGLVIFTNDVVFGATDRCHFNYVAIVISAVGAMLAVAPQAYLVELPQLGRIGTGTGCAQENPGFFGFSRRPRSSSPRVSVRKKYWRFLILPTSSLDVR